MQQICDANEAVAKIAYTYSSVIPLFPITPASPMGEFAEQLATQQKKNSFSVIPIIQTMQSEAGAAGALHGSLSVGTPASTFTSSQGLLLMIPTLYKIAGELLPSVIHVAARSLAYHSLSIYGDHSDVMATRATGWALVSSSSVQEAQDFAAITHRTTYLSSIPFIHFFDGFRTSHEIQKIKSLNTTTLKAFVPTKAIQAFRNNGLTPQRPYAKSGAQNPDVFFQAREAGNSYYEKLPELFEKACQDFEKLTQRTYSLFAYHGHSQATKIIIAMGSSAQTIIETTKQLVAQGEKVGCLIVKLYRPFSVKHFLKKIPSSVTRIAVLDRTKESGSVGEPLYLDVVGSLESKDARQLFKKRPGCYGGRYGLSSKEFTPAMVKGIFDFLMTQPHHNFTVGINDDITHRSISIPSFSLPLTNTTQVKVWGYGSDGCVGSSKLLLKTIGSKDEVQGYFFYDSKKTGGTTISHLRFGKNTIQAPYEIQNPDIVVIAKEEYLHTYDVLEGICTGGKILINSSQKKDVIELFSKDQQEKLFEKNLEVYTLAATKIAQKYQLGKKVGILMQAGLLKLLNKPKFASELQTKAVEEYKKKGKGEETKQAMQSVAKHMSQINLPGRQSKTHPKKQFTTAKDSAFARHIVEPILHLQGNSLPVSALRADGIMPLGTSSYANTTNPSHIPKWNPQHCIQCGFCSFVCPHNAIKIKHFHTKDLANAPKGFDTLPVPNNKNLRFRVQIDPDRCTGCKLCLQACPMKGKALSLQQQVQAKEEQRENNSFFTQTPGQQNIPQNSIKGSQLGESYFNNPSSCPGCGQTTVIKLLTNLFGDRMIIANATGCSSIYGGTFPLTPYATDAQGKGPAWANSLFENAAEYGFGMHLGLTIKEEKTKKGKKNKSKQKAKTSVWIIGGDGWAYDIGFGGLDHIVSQGKNINILVLDNEQYANTGGQVSKATPRGAQAKFATLGKQQPKKNLGEMLLTYKSVFVASVSAGANKQQLIDALVRAQAYPGPSVVIAHTSCIAHGANMACSNKHSQLATTSGYWPLYIYDPQLITQGKNPLEFQTKTNKTSFEKYIPSQRRFHLISQKNKQAKKLYTLLQQDVDKRQEFLQHIHQTNKTPKKLKEERK